METVAISLVSLGEAPGLSGSSPWQYIVERGQGGGALAAKEAPVIKAATSRMGHCGWLRGGADGLYP